MGSIVAFYTRNLKLKNQLEKLSSVGLTIQGTAIRHSAFKLASSCAAISHCVQCLDGVLCLYTSDQMLLATMKINNDAEYTLERIVQHNANQGLIST